MSTLFRFGFKADSVQSLQNALDAAHAKRAKAHAKLAEQFTVFDQSAIEAILQSDAEIRVLSIILQDAEHEGAEDATLKEIIDHQTRPAPRRVFSRSTSLMSNLTEDIVEMVKADLREIAL